MRTQLKAEAAPGSRYIAPFFPCTARTCMPVLLNKETFEKNPLDRFFHQTGQGKHVKAKYSS